MPTSRRTTSRVLARLAIAAATCGGLLLGVIATPSSATTPTNTAPSGLSQCNRADTTITSSCLSGAIRDFNRARAKEGLGPISIPSGFAGWSVPGQILTLTNIERHDRGLAPFWGLSSNLTPYVSAAASAGRDPDFPPWAVEGGSNWGSPRNSLWSFFLWMYDDGPGSPNPCGCWDHRTNMLTAYHSPRIMGAAVGSAGIAVLMLGYDTHDAGPFTPYAPPSISVKVYPSHRVLATWPAPPNHGAPVLGYYVRHDSASWVHVSTRSWTTPVLAPGYHYVSVRSYNRYTSSAIRSVRFYVP